MTMTMTMTFQKFLTKPLHWTLLEGLWLLMLGSQKSQQLKKICFQGHLFWCIRFNYRRGCTEKKMVRFYKQYFYKFSLAVGLTFDRIKGQQSIKTFMTFCLPIKSGFVSKDLQNQTLFCSNESTLIKLKCNHLLAFLCTYRVIQHKLDESKQSFQIEI